MFGRLGGLMSGRAYVREGRAFVREGLCPEGLMSGRAHEYEPNLLIDKQYTPVQGLTLRIR